jgi:hypothetical protein
MSQEMSCLSFRVVDLANRLSYPILLMSIVLASFWFVSFRCMVSSSLPLEGAIATMLYLSMTSLATLGYILWFLAERFSLSISKFLHGSHPVVHAYSCVKGWLSRSSPITTLMLRMAWLSARITICLRWLMRWIVASLPPQLWAEIVFTSTYLIMIRPPAALQGGISLERLFALSLDYLALW